MRKYTFGLTVMMVLMTIAGAAFGTIQSTPIYLTGGTLDLANGAINHAQITTGTFFDFYYTPSGPGGSPTEGVLNQNSFYDVENYWFDLNMAGGLVDMQNTSYSRSDAQWCLQSIWNHTIMAGTISNLDFDSNTGLVSAVLIPFTTVIHWNGTTSDYGSAAYQGFESAGNGERSGGTDFTSFNAVYNVVTGTGTLTPAVPEPSSLCALCGAVIGLFGYGRRRRS